MTYIARTVMLIYGVICYASFVVAITYGMGFVGNLIVPKSIDSGEPSPLWVALLVNGAILALFAVQHTIMARPGFKKWWTQFVPRPIERSTFVFIASAILLLLFWQWRPVPTPVWEVSHPVFAGALWAIQFAGWGIVFVSSFLINHFHLFGLQQVWHHWRGEEVPGATFRLPFLYRIVRHPLMVGFLLAFWSTPSMSVGHLMFAAITTGYIFFGTWIEERDLIREFGDSYLEYRKRVRGLLPVPVRSFRRTLSNVRTR